MALLVVTGIAAEARIAAAAGCRVVCGGGLPDRAARLTEAAIAAGGVSSLISFGIAGGLDPALPSGSLVAADHVVDAATGARIAADPAMTATLRTRCTQAIGGDVLGAAAIVADPGEKARLFAATACRAVDLESLAVARIAAAHRLPFAVLRAVADPAASGLPPAALVPLRPEGGADLPRILMSLACRPGQLPALIRLAGEASAGLKMLRWAARQGALATPA